MHTLDMTEGKPLLRLMNTPEGIFNQTYRYIYVICIGMRRRMACRRLPDPPDDRDGQSGRSVLRADEPSHRDAVYVGSRRPAYPENLHAGHGTEAHSCDFKLHRGTDAAGRRGLDDPGIRLSGRMLEYLAYLECDDCFHRHHVLSAYAEAPAAGRTD